ncbi:MAG: hypothetical protein A4E36_01887 [Methanoregulaceae archaeon PtaB.Bin009]|nr:MAG: hypothetical protein A4E36_01887 [Methanoregulaceae archaeon PtaB.Bin009]
MIRAAFFCPTPDTRVRAFSSPPITAAARSETVICERMAVASAGPTRLTVISSRNISSSPGARKPYSAIVSSLATRWV